MAKIFRWSASSVIGSGTRKVDEASFKACRQCRAQTQTPEVQLPRALDQRTHRAHGIAVASDALPRQDAWDHQREGLRSFALDRIARAEVQDETALDRDEAELNQHLASSYGIFPGAPKAMATIHFSPHAPRWVGSTSWP